MKAKEKKKVEKRRKKDTIEVKSQVNSQYTLLHRRSDIGCLFPFVCSPPYFFLVVFLLYSSRKSYSSSRADSRD